MPGDGGLGSLPVAILLKDANNNIIGASNTIENCSVFFDSIEVHWDLNHNRVWFAKGKSIHLTTGEVLC